MHKEKHLPYPTTPPGAGSNASRPLAIPAPVLIRPESRRRGNLFLDLPIAQRLTLGFLIAAFIAAVAASIIGVQRAQSLSQQSSFYQDLLHANTTLTTDASLLQLMDTETRTIFDATNTKLSKESLAQDQNALQGLVSRYEKTFNSYLAQDLIYQHPTQSTLLMEADHSAQLTQQRTLASSAFRTWHIYLSAQQQVLQTLTTGNLREALQFERLQREPTHADALSALRSLIQFNGSVASSINDAAATEEQKQLVTTIVGSIVAFLGIVLVGLLISNTLVHRLKQLRRVTQAVEQGQFGARITVVGRDEIADVSVSVNAMLDAIVNLLEETRRQRDALTNAAEHLFSDMRVVSSGDLRSSAAVSNDPIGMLANAFNFTVGRFRRFVLRTQTVAEQLDVISRQEIERAETFIHNRPLPGLNMSTPVAYTQKISAPLRDANPTEAVTQQETDNTALIALIQDVHAQVKTLSDDALAPRMRAIVTLTERVSLSLKQIGPLTDTPMGAKLGGLLTQMYLQELRVLENLLVDTQSELLQGQQKTTQGFNSLDADLNKLSSAITVRKHKAATSVAVPPKMPTQDTARQDMGFAQDVISSARKLSLLVQELHAGVVAFQLEA